MKLLGRAVMRSPAWMWGFFPDWLKGIGWKYGSPR